MAAKDAAAAAEKEKEKATEEEESEHEEEKEDSASKKKRKKGSDVENDDPKRKKKDDDDAPDGGGGTLFFVFIALATGQFAFCFYLLPWQPANFMLEFFMSAAMNRIMCNQFVVYLLIYCFLQHQLPNTITLCSHKHQQALVPGQTGHLHQEIGHLVEEQVFIRTHNMLC